MATDQSAGQQGNDANDEQELRQHRVATPVPIVAPVLKPSQARSTLSAPVFKCWADVPDAPTADLLQFKWFVEVFAGKGWLTRAMRRRGWGILPPIDITVAGEVLVAADILDPVFHAKLCTWLSSGAVRLSHFGTPCTSFSIARRDDGGPKPIRSPKHLFGIPSIPARDKEVVRLGSYWTLRSPAAI